MSKSSRIGLKGDKVGKSTITGFRGRSFPFLSKAENVRSQSSIEPSTIDASKRNSRSPFVRSMRFRMIGATSDSPGPQIEQRVKLFGDCEEGLSPSRPYIRQPFRV